MEDFPLWKTDYRPRAQEGVEMTYIAPDGKATPLKLRVRGTDSTAYQRALEDYAKADGERGPRKPTPEEKDAEFWTLQAAMVGGWNLKIALAEGQPGLEYSAANAAQVLRARPDMWEQVRVFARERANFLPGSASS
jgi:hypothetical protein